jgi:hypothetical protein
MKWENLSKLMKEVQEQFQQYGWFERDANGRTISRQKGIFRVNCMDNLDRTNVVMSLFARRTTLMALGLELSFHEQFVLDSPYESFEMVFKNAWADNADSISKMYAGTGALKTDFTRTGKRTFMGAIQDGLNSMTRYFLNNFMDGQRQDALDLVVANYIPDKREETPFTFQQQNAFLFFVMEMSILFILILMSCIFLRQKNKTINNLEELKTSIYEGIIIAIIGFLMMAHLIVKKGMFRSIGRRYVCKPAFSSSGYIRK